jgi:Flp pilus assembly protein TadD
LAEQNKLDEAIAEFRKAIRLNPDNPAGHSNLGVALANLSKPDQAVAAYREAIAECREAIRLKPQIAGNHCNLARALAMQGNENEAIAEYREAIRLEPDSAMALAALGTGLYVQGKPEEAVTAFREAIRLNPNQSLANCNLPFALADQAKLDDALAECREAIRRMPDSLVARKNLASVLGQRGDFAGSLAEYRKLRDQASKELGSSNRWHQAVELAERKANLADRLLAILKGADQTRDNAERLDFARMCRDTMRYAAAARLWAEALETDSGLGQDREAQYFYQGARSAALAAAGRGKDDPLPHDDEKTRLRGQALVWLKAELAVWAKVIDSDPHRTDLAAWEKVFGAGSKSARAAAFYTLREWRRNSDLSSVREPEALAKLTESERKQWQALWAGVDELRKRASEKAP